MKTATLCVRWEGLEPSRLAAHGPQPCLSANSSTSAKQNTLMQAGRIIIGLLCLSSKTFQCHPEHSEGSLKFTETLRAQCALRVTSRRTYDSNCCGRDGER